MKNASLRGGVWCVLLATAAALDGTSQTVPAGQQSLDQVIAAYRAAVGGAALNRVTSWELDAHPLDRKLLSVGRERIALYWKAPNKVRRVNHGTFSDSESAFDGQRGWYLMQHGRPHRMGPDKLDQLNLLCNPLRYLGLAEIYPGSRVEGTGRVNGRDAAIVLATPNWGERRLYFDAETHLLMQIEDRFKSGDKPRVTRFGVYEETEGIRLPREIQMESGDDPDVKGIRIEKVRLNVAIKDIAFESPR